jgi:two-component system OmpR family sensor kinase
VAPDGGVVYPTSGDYPTLSLDDYTRAATGRVQRYYLAAQPESLIVLRPLREVGRVVGVAQLSQPTEPIRSTEQRLLIVLGIASGALMLIAVAVLPLLVGRALRPLRRVTDASTALARGDLERRVDEPGTQDELGLLARAFNQMAVAMQVALNVRARNEQDMRRFVGDASHELRTPLTTIQGQLDMLARGATDDPDSRRRSLESMQHEVRRMTTLVEDLLTLTRLDAAAREAQPDSQQAAVDVDQLIAETVEEQSIRAPQQKVEAVAESPGQAVVRGDREQLRRAIENLATNSVKYAPGGQHTWRSHCEDSRVTITLSDQGPGVDSGDLPRIFDRFYRGRVDGHAAPGSGLGLAIVRSIVEAHGGSITVASSPRGATFTISLPRVDQPEGR